MGESSVDDESDVLELSRNGVELAAVRHRPERIRGELMLDGVAQEQWDHRAVRGKLADPVRSAELHVRRVLRGDGREVRPQVPESLDDDLDADAAGRRPLIRDL